MTNRNYRYVSVMIVCLMICFWVSGQRTTKQINHKLSEKTVVKDSAGNKYAFQHWQELVMSGEFTIVPQFPEQEDTEFFLKQLSAGEKEKRFAAMPRPPESESFKTGASIIPFSEKSIDGDKLRLRDLKGKVVVLNFWFINCPPCRIEIPQLNELVKNYGDSSVVFIAVGLDSRAQIKEFLKNSPFNYKIIDNGKSLADKYNIRTYPTHLVVDRDGLIKFHTSGLALNTIYWLKKTVDEMLSGEKVLQKDK